MNAQSVIALLVPLFPFFVSLAFALYKLLLEKLPSNKQSVVREVVDSVVHAVEQVGADMPAADKKAKAVQMVEGALKEMKIPVPSSLVDTLIEEAVYYLNQSEPSVAQVGFTSSK